jgi:hypothetical protein
MRAHPSPTIVHQDDSARHQVAASPPEAALGCCRSRSDTLNPEIDALLHPSRRRTTGAMLASASRLSECHQGAGAGAVDSQLGPAVTVISALPESAVGEADEQPAANREQRIGHRRQRLR